MSIVFSYLDFSAKSQSQLMTKNRRIFFLKIIITIGLLSFFLHKTDLSQLTDSLLGISLYMIFVNVLLYLISIAIASYKWELLIPDYSLLFLMKYNLIGAYYSLVLPGQISGEVVKSYMLSKDGSEPHKIIASVFVDKVTGLISLMLIGVLGVKLSSQTIPKEVTCYMLIFLVLFITILIVIRLKIIYKTTVKITNYFAVKLPVTQSFFDHVVQFIDEWNIYSKKVFVLIISVLVGILFHVFAILINYLLARELGIEVSYFDWCWIYGLLSIVLLLPISIAGIGIREGTLISILGLFGVSIEKAMAFSIALTGLCIFVAIAGVLLIFSKRLNQ